MTKIRYPRGKKYHLKSREENEYGKKDKKKCKKEYRKVKNLYDLQIFLRKWDKYRTPDDVTQEDLITFSKNPFQKEFDFSGRQVKSWNKTHAIVGNHHEIRSVNDIIEDVDDIRFTECTE